MIEQARTLSYNKIELGVPWQSVQLSKTEFDFSTVDERLNYLLSRGLRCRLRINAQEPVGHTYSSEAGYTPEVQRSIGSLQLPTG